MTAHPPTPRPLLFALLAWLISLACGPVTSGTPAAPPTRPPPATQPLAVATPEPTDSEVQLTSGGPAVEATAVPATTAPPEIVIERTVVFGSGPFNLLDPRAGLAGLSSYAATLTITFEGAQNGEPLPTSRTYTLLAGLEPAARQLTIEASAGADSLQPVFLAIVAGVAYESQGDAGCRASVPGDEEAPAQQMEPAGFLHSVIGANAAGIETVNGVEAQHYTFDQRALDQEGQTQATGEVWVASDGGYVVRYLLTTTAGPDYWGDGLDGALTWDYELTNANVPVQISLPADCPPGLVDAPLPPDAANVESLPGALSFETSASRADVAALYREAMPARGWTVQGDPISNDSGDYLMFAKDDLTLNIVILTDSGLTQVNLLLHRVTAAPS